MIFEYFKVEENKTLEQKIDDLKRTRPFARAVYPIRTDRGFKVVVDTTGELERRLECIAAQIGWKRIYGRAKPRSAAT